MRFLHVNHRYFPFRGGSELYIKELSERLVALRHEVRVVTCNAFDLDYFWDHRKRPVNAPSRENVNGVEVRRLAVGHFPGQRFVTPVGRRAMAELARMEVSSCVLDQMASFFPKIPQLEASLAEAGAPDCVLATNVGFEGLALGARKVARKYDVPLVVIPFAHLGIEDDDTVRRYVSMPHQLALLRSADLVLALTDKEADFMRSLGVEAGRVRAIYCGASEALVTGGCGANLREKLESSATLIGALGALAPEKGTPHVVQAVANMRRRGAPVELVLVGPVLASFERWWRAFPATMRDGIHILETVDDGEKRDFLDAIQMLVMPSRTESFGIVYLEAWLNRKPVIAARAGAVPEVVQDGDNGILVTFGDVEEIERAIIRLSTDPALRERLGSAGRERARALYTWDGVFKRFREAYADVLGINLGKAR